MTERDTLEHARQNARGWLESIQEMVSRLEHAQECDADIETCKHTLSQASTMVWPIQVKGIDFDEYHDADKAREAIEESILDLTLSGDWHPGETPEASRYTILLTTGGPALRIVGDLSNYGEPDTAQLEMQDWGTPWTYFSMDRAILAFARCFYFGD